VGPSGDRANAGEAGLGYILGMASRPVVLSIAGYDPSSGAGVTADIKTAAALGCYAVTCVTALTIQSTQGVFEVEPVGPEVVRQTLARLAEDVDFAAVRIGTVGSGAVAEVVAEFLRQYRPPNVVLDPVLRSSSGAELIDVRGLRIIRGKLLPFCDVATPNMAEAAELAGEDPESLTEDESWESALPRLRLMAGRIHELGCSRVIVTCGHIQENNDYLSISASGRVEEHVFPGTRLKSRATHGTGCAFAMALACELASGSSLGEAVGGAKEFVRKAIEAAYPIGKGTGPMNHLFGLDEGK